MTDLALFDAPPEETAVAIRQGKIKKVTRRRLQLMETDPTCYYCGCDLRERPSTLDHLIPECRGGTDCFSNLRLCCADCNSCKGDALPAEWLEELRSTVILLARRLAGLRCRIKSESLDRLNAKLPRMANRPLKVSKPKTVSDELTNHDFHEHRATYQIIDTKTGQILVRGLRLQGAVHYLRAIGPDESLGLVCARRLYNAQLGLVRQEFNVFDGEETGGAA